MRPAATLMHPDRAGAAYPNPLNFARTFMRELVQGRWQLQKVRVDLDSEGRGEVLYRLHSGKHVFHFFVISNSFAQDQNYCFSSFGCERANDLLARYRLSRVLASSSDLGRSPASP